MKTDAKKDTDLVVRNPGHPVKSTTDTAIDVDIEYKSILGKRSAPKRKRSKSASNESTDEDEDEENGNETPKRVVVVLDGNNKVVCNAAVNALPNDCVVITINTFSDMKVQLDDQQVTINRLRSDLAEQRDLVKEQKEVIGEFRDTNKQLEDEVNDYKENLNEAAKVLNRLRRHITAGIAAGQRQLGDEYDGIVRIFDFVSSRRNAD